MQVANNPGGAYNPLFIYGGAGLGKTHLIHAIGNAILKENPDKVVRYVHAEDYYSDVVRAYQQKSFDAFKRTYRSLDVLLLDGHRDFQQSGASIEERVLSERLLIQALDCLNERERLVLTLYYQHELSLKEIGLVLEISDARVCQLSKQAIDKARHFLTKSN